MENLKKSMKKIMTISLVTAMLGGSAVTVLPAVAEGGIAASAASEGTTAEGLVWLDNYDGDVVICGYTGKGGGVVIPSEIDGRAVKEIGGYTFDDCTGLTSVTIPDSVTKIGDNAFAGCTGLTSITIPDGVKEISSYVFSDCKRLANVAIPGGVTKIEISAFSGCSGLTSVTIPDSVTEIEKSAFSGCSGLKSVTIPDGVTEIGDNAFEGCTGLTSVTISDSVTEIGSYAFSGCSGLTGVTISNSVTDIGWHAFSDCSGLTSINVDKNNRNYTSENGVLFNKDKSSLIQYPGGKKGAYTISDSVTDIDWNSFENCTGLTSVTIGKGIKEISLEAFSGCTGLTSVTISDSVTLIDSYAFSGCTGLTSVTIPDSVTKIGTSAFQGCTGLTSVTVPGNVTEIGDDAFGYYMDEKGERYLHTDLIIFGKVGSVAEEYAGENGIPFVDVDNPVIPVVRLTLDKTEAEIEAGKTLTLTATITPDNAADKTITWKTDNNKVATVENGTVKAVGGGRATIIARTSNGETATCEVTVKEVKATDVKLNKTSLDLEKGKSEKLTATIIPSNASNKSVTWISSDTKVATVSNGTVEAVSAGTAIITVLTANGKMTKCEVKVSQTGIDIIIYVLAVFVVLVLAAAIIIFIRRKKTEK